MPFPENFQVSSVVCSLKYTRIQRILLTKPSIALVALNEKGNAILGVQDWFGSEKGAIDKRETALKLFSILLFLHFYFSRHLRTLKKCRKHSPVARVFYISLGSCSQMPVGLGFLFYNRLKCIKVIYSIPLLPF